EIPLNVWVIQNSIWNSIRFLQPTRFAGRPSAFGPSPPLFDGLRPLAGGRGRSEVEVPRGISTLTGPRFGASGLAGPRPVGDLAPARADRLERALRQGAGPEERRVLRPAVGPRGPHDRGVNPRHGQREAQRRAGGLGRVALQERVVEGAEAS